MDGGTAGCHPELGSIQFDMKTPPSKYCTTPTLRIEYSEYGDPHGEPLILLHGFPDAPVAWSGVIADLPKRGLRILAPCLRGYGKTEVLLNDLVGGQEAALGTDLLEFANALELEAFHLAGHDWGARASYAACVFAPDRIKSLLALATPYVLYGGRERPAKEVRAQWYQWFFQLEQGRKMMEESTEAFCLELWRSWSPGWRFSKRDFAAAAEFWKNPQFVATVLHYYRTRWGGALSLRAYESLQAKLNGKPKVKISVPTIFVQGGMDESDLPAGSEEQSDYFTGGYRRVILKGVGHFPNRENPAVVAKLLQSQL
jgi:pimeloyl-ACP methyl ester carboxylesterase